MYNLVPLEPASKYIPYPDVFAAGLGSLFKLMIALVEFVTDNVCGAGM